DGICPKRPGLYGRIQARGGLVLAKAAVGAKRRCQRALVEGKAGNQARSHGEVRARRGGFDAVWIAGKAVIVFHGNGGHVTGDTRIDARRAALGLGKLDLVLDGGYQSKSRLHRAFGEERDLAWGSQQAVIVISDYNLTGFG